MIRQFDVSDYLVIWPVPTHYIQKITEFHRPADIIDIGQESMLATCFNARRYPVYEKIIKLSQEPLDHIVLFGLMLTQL